MQPSQRIFNLWRFFFLQKFDEFVHFVHKTSSMNIDSVYSGLTLAPKGKLVLLVLDGLGDIAVAENDFKTPLEAAQTPNLDRLAKSSAQGRLIPVAHGITPGSGPGHLGLFGYDPLEYQVGRGVIEALGLGFELKPGDIAARANFCSLDASGLVTDRRAGRIETSVCEELTAILSENITKLDDGTEVFIRPGKGHRFVVVFRGSGMLGPISDADPNREGFSIPDPAPTDPLCSKQQKTAANIQEFYKKALPLLEGKQPANGFLMRGIAHQPDIPLFQERYMLKPACIAVYPMYKGLAQLVGMTKLEGAASIEDEIKLCVDNWEDYDFFFIHFKDTDMHGEDGNFSAKVEAIERLDKALPELLAKNPQVLAITGDHSTPCPVGGHSWHPQPALLNSLISGSDKLQRFTETDANSGSLGIIEAKHLIRHMQANAKMFDKFGA